MLPAGAFKFDTTAPPAAISVPRNPARAAAAIRSRSFLPSYRLAAAGVSRETRFREVQQVVFGRDFDGSPLVNVLSAHAMRLLLDVHSAWLLDPESGLCRPRNPAADADELVRSAGTLLQTYGYEVTLTSEHPRAYTFRPPIRPVVPPAPSPPHGRPSGPAR
ncbi:hypothetical protein OTB20_18850 [Streptomyces sp. H27-H1]|uniref:hypothetical protein n=1 Tax=Streptomyces sp. H27-H1 TaxID=2996461 RepID=UPI00227199C0|nr:hypothetical protein [Streptomyces sp. H27-H1]MCY0928217.1 hypothetical protein [Streptomyces sp. H27-H1]